MAKMIYKGKTHDIPDYRVQKALRNGFKLVSDKPEPKVVKKDHDQDKGEL